MNSEMERLQRFIADVDVSGVAEGPLTELLEQVRLTQRRLDGLVARIAERAATLAESDGGPPPSDLLRGGGAVSARQAAREQRRSALLAAAPALSCALSTGSTTADHVDALVGLLSNRSVDDLSSETLSELAERASRLPIENFRRSARRLLATAPGDEAASEQRRRRASEFRHWFDHETGMGRFSGSLDPERYEALVGAVERCARRLAAEDPEPVACDAHLAAEALVQLALGGSGPGGHRAAAEIIVVVGPESTDSTTSGSLRQTENGHDLSAGAVERLACDAILRRVVVDHLDVPVNVGRRHRTATAAQWAALKAIHHSCAWDGCDLPISWCQAHHILPWTKGGRTDLDNLVPLCSRHHHAVHEGGWSIKLLPDRSLEIFRPSGRHASTVPTPKRC